LPGQKEYSVTLDGVTVKATDPGEALEVAADLIEGLNAFRPTGLVITCDGELDETLMGLAREGLRPVRVDGVDGVDGKIRTHS
jgi:hypothetical protein